MSPVYRAALKSGSNSPSHVINTKLQQNSDMKPVSEEHMNAINSTQNGSCHNNIELDHENGMEVHVTPPFTVEDKETVSNGTVSNGVCCDEDDCEMEVDLPHQKRQLCGGSQIAIEKMLQFGRDLQQLSVYLRQEHGKNDTNKKMLQNAFSLLAYADPWSSPVGHQLNPVEREPVCAALNSAILESHNMPRQPPLELVIGQVKECTALMSKAGMGSCAFVNTDMYVCQH